MEVAGDDHTVAVAAAAAVAVVVGFAAAGADIHFFFFHFLVDSQLEVANIELVFHSWRIVFCFLLLLLFCLEKPSKKELKT